jgi:hypothetical protein
MLFELSSKLQLKLCQIKLINESFRILSKPRFSQPKRFILLLSAEPPAAKFFRAHASQLSLFQSFERIRSIRASHFANTLIFVFFNKAKISQVKIAKYWRNATSAAANRARPNRLRLSRADAIRPFFADRLKAGSTLDGARRSIAFVSGWIFEIWKRLAVAVIEKLAANWSAPRFFRFRSCLNISRLWPVNDLLKLLPGQFLAAWPVYGGNLGRNKKYLEKLHFWN